MACRYYSSESIRLESQDPGKPTKYVLCLSCKHEFSPVTRKRAQEPGNGQILKCEGDISRCELPAEHRAGLVV